METHRRTLLRTALTTGVLAALLATDGGGPFAGDVAGPDFPTGSAA